MKEQNRYIEVRSKDAPGADVERPAGAPNQPVRGGDGKPSKRTASEKGGCAAERARVAVVGGGAAGMAAAIAASRAGAAVVLLEKNEKLGKKLYITGKGRCNVTNACPRQEFLENVVRNPKFLYGSLAALDQSGLMALLEEAGCPLKVERGNRVFPVSDRASDVTKALVKNLREVSVRLNAGVRRIRREEKGFCLETEDGPLFADRVVLATGGLSYPSTGSTGDGYAFARSLGHRVTDLVPSLVGLRAERPTPELAGLTLRNVRATIRLPDGRSWSEFGELLFTHTGVSGPAVLTLSARVNRDLTAGARLLLDLKPALTAEELDRRLLRELETGGRKSYKSVSATLLPRSLVPVFVAASGVPEDRPAGEISREERRRIGRLLKEYPIPLAGLGDWTTAVVTSGGADLSEIDPKTMQSKRVPGLFFAGELLDVDALTGGFNLQIAFSTGWLAGTCAAGGGKLAARKG